MLWLECKCWNQIRGELFVSLSTMSLTFFLVLPWYRIWISTWSSIFNEFEDTNRIIHTKYFIYLTIVSIIHGNSNGGNVQLQLKTHSLLYKLGEKLYESTLCMKASPSLYYMSFFLESYLLISRGEKNKEEKTQYTLTMWQHWVVVHNDVTTCLY